MIHHDRAGVGTMWTRDRDSVDSRPSPKTFRRDLRGRVVGEKATGPFRLRGNTSRTLSYTWTFTTEE